MRRKSRQTYSGEAKMTESYKTEALPDLRNEYWPLVQWFQQGLACTPQPKAELTSISDNGARFGDDYHMKFYQQLPDFVLALLHDDTQATLRFAPLLFHLIGCPTCHAAYLEIYDAMRATMVPGEIHLLAGNGTYSMAPTSTRMLVYLCRLLTTQPETQFPQPLHKHF